MSVASLFASGNLLDNDYSIFCNSLTTNIISSSSTNITNFTSQNISVSGSLSTNKFVFKTNFIEAPVSAQLTAANSVNSIIRCTSVAVGTVTLTLPSAAGIFALLPNLELGSTFSINLVNYNVNGPVVFASSIDGTFVAQLPVPSCIPAVGTAQSSRMCYGVVISLDSSAAGAIVLY